MSRLNRRLLTMLLAASLPGGIAAFVIPSALAAPPTAKSTKPPAPPKPPAVAAPAGATLNPLERQTAALVRDETLRSITAGLTDPAMEGRGTGQPGGEKAAQYLAERFQALGLKPLGENKGYLQSVLFDATESLAESKITVGDATLALGDDFVPLPVPGAGDDASGDVVFIGFGVKSPALKRDDLAGLDLKGKIVVLLSSGKPANADAAVWKKEADQQRVMFPLILGGAKAILLANVQMESLGYTQLADYMTRRQASLAGSAGAFKPPFPIPPVLAVSDAGVEKLFAGSGTTYTDLKAKALLGENVSRGLGKAATVHLVKQTDSNVRGSNVVGVLEGADPTLKAEAVVFSAHYDAWGKRPNGTIYPGAADNALGVAEMLAIAEALVKSPRPPRRSVVFLAVTGEEHGLLGSQYWVGHPTWPAGKVVADLNFDGVGSEILGPVKTLTGYGAEYSNLGVVLKGAAQAYGCRIVPDPMPEEHAFERSDHFTFVQKGIPALMLLGGMADVNATLVGVKAYMKNDYHLATDVIRPNWDWSGPKTIAQVLLLVGERVANADKRPAWYPTAPWGKAAAPSTNGGK